MYYFGIDLGGTNISAGLVDENYKIILKKEPSGSLLCFFRIFQWKRGYQEGKKWPLFNFVEGEWEFW